MIGGSHAKIGISKNKVISTNQKQEHPHIHTDTERRRERERSSFFWFTAEQPLKSGLGQAEARSFF